MLVNGTEAAAAETKRASWGAILYKRPCRECGEVCWFQENVFFCNDCTETPSGEAPLPVQIADQLGKDRHWLSRKPAAEY